MADVAAEIDRLGLELPTDMGTSGPMADLWRAAIDESPPPSVAQAPSSLLATATDADQAEWTVSQAVELIPGVEARVFFFST